MFNPSSRTRSTPFNSSTRIADRDRTVATSEPSSRTTLIGEQPNPLDLLQPQDDEPTSRCKHCRRYELLGSISLLSPRTFYPPRMAFHSEPPDHYDRFSSLLDLPSGSQAGLCHCTLRILTVLSLPSHARYYLGGDRPSQTTHHTMSD